MREAQVQPGPLDGVRVIDLTSVIMGPFATHILADLGADVIKVETPEGDTFRHYHPKRNAGMSGSFLHLNRNKRSIVLDLKSSRGKAVLSKLLETADVFVHSLRPKSIERLGFSYEQVSAIRPDIIYCSAVGFGSQGPYADKPAYDDLIQAGSGLAALGMVQHGHPAYVSSVVCDKLCGQAIAYAVNAALFQRASGRGGQAIEVPMFEATIEFNFIEHFLGFAFDPPLAPPGFNRVLSPVRKPYRTRDGYACILPYSDENWRDFSGYVGRDDVLRDDRFRTLADRAVNIDALYAIVEEEAPRRSTAEWVEFCDRSDIPCMPMLRLEELPQDEHVKAVDLFQKRTHPTEGGYQTIRRPVVFHGTDFVIRRDAPLLGEHTEEILREIGFDGQEVMPLSRSEGAREKREVVDE